MGKLVWCNITSTPTHGAFKTFQDPVWGHHLVDFRHQKINTKHGDGIITATPFWLHPTLKIGSFNLSPKQTNCLDLGQIWHPNNFPQDIVQKLIRYTLLSSFPSFSPSQRRWMCFFNRSLGKHPCTPFGGRRVLGFFSVKLRWINGRTPQQFVGGSMLAFFCSRLLLVAWETTRCQKNACLKKKACWNNSIKTCV